MIAISDKNYALVFRAMQEKQASSNLRVKIARHVINMKLLEREIATYNLDRLQKAASDGHSKIARMKFAALVLQHQVEKRAVLGALLKGLGRGAINMGGKAIGGALGLGAKGVRTAVKNPVPSLLGTGMGIGVTGQVFPQFEPKARAAITNRMYNTGQAIQKANPPGSPLHKMVDDVTLMNKYPKQTSQGFGSGFVQAAKNTLPGRGLSAFSDGLGAVSSLFGQ